MDDQQHILDEAFSENPKSQPPTDKGKRFTNFIIDRLLMVVLYQLLLSATVDNFLETLNLDEMSLLGSNVLISWGVLVFYYTFFEINMDGKTPGKYFTRTKAVTMNGEPLTSDIIIKRSLARIIPFEPLSYLGVNPLGWHDTLSNTKVVDDEGRF